MSKAMKVPYHPKAPEFNSHTCSRPMHKPQEDPTPDNESLGFLVRGAYRAFTRQRPSA
jgi:hypothetical protein